MVPTIKVGCHIHRLCIFTHYMIKHHFMESWIHPPTDTVFSIYNIPFGICSDKQGRYHACTRIGDLIINLHDAADIGLFFGINLDPKVLKDTSLNAFIALGKSVTEGVRSTIQRALVDDQSILRAHPRILRPSSDVTMHLPVEIKDYTDFYSSMDHAYNVGVMFRDPARALLPNWKHLPVGYHGRASSIIPSGVPIHRPLGQTHPGDGPPIYGPSKRMDFELEMAFIIGKPSHLGQRISTVEAPDYIFGMVLFNDWSARDIQKWEYVPLGPFLGKSFASSISPWIVTMEALSFAKTPGPSQDPTVLPYLQYTGDHHYDINLEVGLTPQDGVETIISRSNYRYMYWNIVQQLAHHTSNGCNVNVGDMMASGTISGPEPSAYGSMLELCWAGTKDIHLQCGQKRKFLEDHDSIRMSGHAIDGEKRVGFGEVRTTLLPAIPYT